MIDQEVKGQSRSQEAEVRFGELEETSLWTLRGEGNVARARLVVCDVCVSVVSCHVVYDVCVSVVSCHVVCDVCVSVVSRLVVCDMCVSVVSCLVVSGVTRV